MFQLRHPKSVLQCIQTKAAHPSIPTLQHLKPILSPRSSHAQIEQTEEIASTEATEDKDFDQHPNSHHQQQQISEQQQQKQHRQQQPGFMRPPRDGRTNLSVVSSGQAVWSSGATFVQSTDNGACRDHGATEVHRSVRVLS